MLYITFVRRKGTLNPNISTKVQKYKRHLKERKGKEKEKRGANKQQANLIEVSEKNDFLFLTSIPRVAAEAS